jgi:serine/threonine protein phosphatase 1
MRVFAIGDIHGALTALETLASVLEFKSDDIVITLGDYVDRGPNSKEVIDFLIALQQRTNLIALRGNHEVMMLETKTDPGKLLHWIGCGGGETLESYDTETLDDIPAEHWKFLASTKKYHEREKNFFVHANAAPQVPLSEQSDYMLYWEHIDSPPKHYSGKRMVCGHTRQKSGLPLNLGHAVCIDTWAYGNGWLTGLEVETNVYWQANQDGKVRRHELGS